MTQEDLLIFSIDYKYADLSGVEREMVELYALDDQSYKEVADEMGASSDRVPAVIGGVKTYFALRGYSEYDSLKHVTVESSEERRNVMRQLEAGKDMIEVLLCGRLFNIPREKFIHPGLLKKRATI